jgi:hypothetical protein
MKKFINFCLIPITLAFSPVLHAQGQGLKPLPQSPLGDAQEELPSEEQEMPSPQSQQPDEPKTSERESQSNNPSEADGNEPWRVPEGTQNDATQESTTPEAIPSDDEDEGTPVGQAASEGSNAARKKQWQNIAIATVAVAVAVTALILIASNDGRRADE